MSCKRFQQQLGNFIKDEMLYEDMDFFVSHSKRCKDCYEELEISYLMTVGMELFDKNDLSSFNLKGQLTDELNKLEERADRHYKFRVFNTIVTSSSYMCILIVIIRMIILLYSVF